MAGMSPDCSKRKGLYKAQVKKVECVAQSVMETIQYMINPFQHETDQLVSLSSGVVASDAIKQDLLCARQTGEKALLRFMNDRLISQNDDIDEAVVTTDQNASKKPKVQPDIFSPLTPYFSHLKTFGDLSVSKSTKTTSGKEVIIKK